MAEVIVSCQTGGGVVELMSSMDLFMADAGDDRRHVLFDLSPLLALDPPPCSLESALIQLRPVDESQALILDPEADDAKLQIVRY